MRASCVTDYPACRDARAPRQAWFLRIAIGLLALLVAPHGARAAGAIALSADGARVEVSGLPEATLAALVQTPPTAEGWSKILSLHVDANADAAAPPVMGRHAVDGRILAFIPRFPLRPGLAYRAVLNTEGLAGASPAVPALSEQIVTIPKPPPTAPTEVAAVYPTADELPENLLKFYLEFSAPMDRGDSYRHIRILDAAGEEVPYAFLRLQEELWSPDRRRFTLLFDPGRIKRGLKPREDEGLPLVEGRQYTLAIDAAWRDAQGEPLQAGFRKPFRVVAPDVKQPDPHAWKLAPPPAGTRDDLVVTFDEPLDHALAERMIFVADAHSREVDGTVRIDAGETRWSFTPATAWAAGKYDLVVDGTLEDRAGNSPGRPFEVANATEEVGVTAVREVVVPFEIQSPAEQ
jgi:hypothetical protein